MKTVKLLLSVALFSLWLTGCSDDSKVDDPIDELTGKGYLISETYENGVLLSKYEYNNDNQLVKLIVFDQGGAENGRTTYSYDAGGRIVSTVVQSGDQAVRTDFEYNNDGQLMKSILYDNNSDPIATYDYTYEGNKIIQTMVSGGQTTSVLTSTMEGQNLVRQELEVPGIPQASWVLERSDFDGKKVAWSLPEGLVFGGSGSSPKRETQTMANGVINFDWEWRYTYNDDGYVTSATNYEFGSDEPIDFFEYKLIRAK